MKQFTFKSFYAGYYLKITFSAKQTDPRPQDHTGYEINFISAVTCQDYIDIHLLASAIEKINTLVIIDIQKKCHEMYQQAVINEYKQKHQHVRA